MCRDSRSKLLVWGFELRNISVQVYDSNPYSTGAKNLINPVIKISGLPLSVDNSAILGMLNSVEITTKSDLKYEKIRKYDQCFKRQQISIHRTTNQQISTRNGTCAGLKCRLYH